MKLNLSLRRICVMLGWGLASASVSAQTTHSFSVQQTLDHAMKNSVAVRNALLDIRIQKQTNREFTAISLPQINGSLQTIRYFDIPVNTIPDFISPSVYNVLIDNGVVDGNGNPIVYPPGGFGSVPARFGTNWNASGGVDFSQVLFDGQVFVGLKARSAALTFATQSYEVTREQVRANVYKLYYQLLVARKQAGSIDANIQRFEKLLADTREIYKNGFAEKLDVDKVEVQLNNLKTEKLKIENQIDMGYAALKFLIHLPQQDRLVLTDSLRVEDVMALTSADTVDVNNRKEYQQLKTAEVLGAFNVQRFRLSRFPTLALFGTYSKNGQRNDFDFFGKGPWFTTSLMGVRLNVPIFDGQARNARISRARLELQKIRNNKEQLEQAIRMETENAREKLRSALVTLDNQKKNTALAEKVFTTTELKYQQGLGSNLEIYNAQTELEVAQNNYYAAIYDAIIAKIDLLKAVGKLP